MTVTTSGGTTGAVTLTITGPTGIEDFATPGQYTFTVPEGVTEITIRTVGAQGGTGIDGFGQSAGVGGAGARAVSTIEVNPGDVLTVLVGGKGDDGNTDWNADGGFNGGGRAFGPYGGGGGGGASEVRAGEVRLVVAGGGGGGGWADQSPYVGGAGGVGGENGGDGGHGSNGGGEGGSGGTSTSAGAGGGGSGEGEPGSGSLGGVSHATLKGGGGGGGGLFGGGAGGKSLATAGGGGGGSSLGDVIDAGVGIGDGFVLIAWGDVER